MTNGEGRTPGKRPGITSRLSKHTIEQLYLQKSRLAAALNLDELGISTCKIIKYVKQ